MDQRISSYLLQLRRHHPFLATISLMATYQFDAQTDNITADGKSIQINPDYFQQLAIDEKNGLLLHATLHNALLHPIRCGVRDLQIWNIAADIVVNQIIIEAGAFKPPPNTAVEPKYADLSVEQVYEKLCVVAKQLAGSAAQKSSNSQQQQKTGGGGKSGSPDQSAEQIANDLLSQIYPAIADLQGKPPQQSNSQSHPQAQRDQKALENHWKAAFKKAEAVQRLHQKNRGQLPAGLLREIDTLYQPELDWKTLLWRFVSKTPCDYSGYDRRFLYQKLYLEQLESESLTLIVAIDTSGSIEKEELSQFISELSAILNAYPFIEATLFYVDAEVYGPYPIDANFELPPICGDGGTDFRDLFRIAEQQRSPFDDMLCIYMTDGDGEFPAHAPSMPVLWVVCNGGLESHRFPFGEVARLSISR